MTNGGDHETGIRLLESRAQPVCAKAQTPSHHPARREHDSLLQQTGERNGDRIPDSHQSVSSGMRRAGKEASAELVECPREAGGLRSRQTTTQSDMSPCST